MQDELKITVIATGFKNDVPARKDRTVNAAQAAISTARTASAYQVQPAAARVVNGSPMNGGSIGHATHSSPSARVAAPARENPNLATMTDSIRSAVEQDDLDVPAFIRKRGEIN